MFKSIIATAHHQLVTNAPKALLYPSTICPFVIQQKLLKTLLDKVFAEAIEDGDVDFLEGKWLKVEVLDLQLVWYLSFENEKLIIAQNCTGESVSFSGNVNDLILIAGRKEDPDTLFFQRRLSIEGDTELGLEVKNLLDNIDFENLPPLAQKALQHFSEFIQKGMQVPSSNIAIMP